MNLNAHVEQAAKAILEATVNGINIADQIALAQAHTPTPTDWEPESLYKMLCFTLQQKMYEHAKLFLMQGVSPNPGPRSALITPLMILAYEGAAAMLRLVLEHGAIVDATDSNGTTALTFAAFCATGLPVECIQHLLHCKANINAANKDQITPLIAAVDTGNVITARELLRHKLNPNCTNNWDETPLLLASYRNKPEIVAALLKYPGIDINKATADGVTPLLVASHNGLDTIVELLCAHGARTDLAKHDTGMVPLTAAIKGGYVQCIDILIRYGANVNCTSNCDSTPLLFAVARPNRTAAVIRKLVCAGANVNAMGDGGETVLAVAMIQTMMLNETTTEIISLLIAAGANVNARTTEKRLTALHVAVSIGALPIIVTILAAGANINARNGRGETPLDVAIRTCRGTKEWGPVWVLLLAGAKNVENDFGDDLDIGNDPVEQAGFLIAIESARAEIEAARQILALERPPAALALLPPCTICSTPTALHCIACPQVYYCSAKCQLDDWKNHKSVCNKKKKTTSKQ